MQLTGGKSSEPPAGKKRGLLNAAKYYEHARHSAPYGVRCEGVTIDQKAVIERKRQVVKTLVSGVKAKMRAHKVTVFMEEAKITGKTAEGFTVVAGGKEYTGKKLIIATGSSAIVPPIPGVRENLGSFVLTNREILDLEEIPQKLTVIGGGVIGLEMAAYFATIGSQVTVIEMLSHIAGATDLQIGKLLQKELEAKGIRFLLQHKCLEVQSGKVLAEGLSGNKVTVEADKVLLSIGRQANCKNLGLETIGVEFDRAIRTDAQGRTNVEGVFAVGDVNGHHMLAHTAYREAEVAVNVITGKQDAMRYHANPSVIYTSPEVASVGMTEEECKQKGRDYEVQSLSMRYSGRFVAENEGGDGLCKIIIDKKKRNILGVHMIGAYAGEMIWGAAQMIELQLRVTDARQIIFPHPTVSEIIRETLWEFPD